MSSLFMSIISVPYLNEIYFDFETSFKRVSFISLLSTIKPNGPSLRFFDQNLCHENPNLLKRRSD